MFFLLFFIGNSRAPRSRPGRIPDYSTLGRKYPAISHGHPAGAFYQCRAADDSTAQETVSAVAAKAPSRIGADVSPGESDSDEAGWDLPRRQGREDSAKRPVNQKSRSLTVLRLSLRAFSMA